MARSIKHYNGFYTAQNTNFMDTASTGYTVPTGKVARIGFSFSAYGGSYSAWSMGGFYAGTSASASTTNRFLVCYVPVTTSANATNKQISVHYTPNHGHYWETSDVNYNPRLHIMQGQAVERFTTRETNNWLNNNFKSFSDSGYATLLNFSNSTTTTTSMPFGTNFPHTTASWISQYGVGSNGLTGEVHAYAGETIYLYDFAGSNGQTNLNYRPFRQCAWDLFIIEEDAG